MATEPIGRVAAPDHTVPPPPLSQLDNPLGDLAKPAAVAPAQANTAGSIPSDVPPGSAPQTMSSTISESNARLDRLPTAAWQFPLTEAQQGLISKGVEGVPNKRVGKDLSGLHVADLLPAAEPIEAFPTEVTDNLPARQ